MGTLENTSGNKQKTFDKVQVTNTLNIQVQEAGSGTKPLTGPPNKSNQ